MRFQFRLFTVKRIRIHILLLIKVMGICDHCSIDTPYRALFWASRSPLWGSSAPLRLYFESLLKFSIFDFNVDPGPAFHSNGDPDPASKNIAYPCESGSANLPVPILYIICSYLIWYRTGNPVVIHYEASSFVFLTVYFGWVLNHSKYLRE